MIEAMACGTPVIAFRRGSVPEVVEHGVSGFIVDDEAEAIEAVHQVSELDRRKVRASFERRFTSIEMARDYVACYERVSTEAGASSIAGAVVGAGEIGVLAAPHVGPKLKAEAACCAQPGCGVSQHDARRLRKRPSRVTAGPLVKFLPTTGVSIVELRLAVERTLARSWEVLRHRDDRDRLRWWSGRSHAQLQSLACQGSQASIERHQMTLHHASVN